MERARLWSSCKKLMCVITFYWCARYSDLLFILSVSSDTLLKKYLQSTLILQ